MVDDVYRYAVSGFSKTRSFYYNDGIGLPVPPELTAPFCTANALTT